MASESREKVSLGVGLQRFDGVLVIRPGLLDFEPSQSSWAFESGPITVERHLLASSPVRWELTLGHDTVTKNPIVLRTHARRARRVMNALALAGYEVQVQISVF